MAVSIHQLRPPVVLFGLGVAVLVLARWLDQAPVTRDPNIGAGLAAVLGLALILAGLGWMIIVVMGTIRRR